MCTILHFRIDPQIACIIPSRKSFRRICRITVPTIYSSTIPPVCTFFYFTIQYSITPLSTSVVITVDIKQVLHVANNRHQQTFTQESITKTSL